MRVSAVWVLVAIGAALHTGCAETESSCENTARCSDLPASTDSEAEVDAMPSNAQTDVTDAIPNADALSEVEGPVTPQDDDGAREGPIPSEVEASDSRSDEARPDDALEVNVSVDCMPNDGGCEPAVFVSPRGFATGDGTTARPFNSLTTAVTRAKAINRPVYACEDGTGFVEALTVDGSLEWGRRARWVRLHPMDARALRSHDRRSRQRACASLAEPYGGCRVRGLRISLRQCDFAGNEQYCCHRQQCPQRGVSKSRDHGG